MHLRVHLLCKSDLLYWYGKDHLASSVYKIYSEFRVSFFDTTGVFEISWSNIYAKFKEKLMWLSPFINFRSLYLVSLLRKYSSTSIFQMLIKKLHEQLFFRTLLSSCASIEIVFPENKSALFLILKCKYQNNVKPFHATGLFLYLLKT